MPSNIPNIYSDALFNVYNRPNIPTKKGSQNGWPYFQTETPLRIFQEAAEPHINGTNQSATSSSPPPLPPRLQSRPIWLQTVWPVCVAAVVVICCLLALGWRAHARALANAQSQHQEAESAKMWREAAQQLVQSQFAETRVLNSNQAAFAASQAQIVAGLLKLSDLDTQLLQQFAAAQTNVRTLGQQLQITSTEALISKEKLAAVQAELRRQSEQAAAVQQQLAHLTQSNQLILNEKQRLAGQLQIAEAEKRMASEQVGRMQEEVKVERGEKAQLAEGVKALATRSDQLAQVIQQNRPLASNTIFSQFLTNRVRATIWTARSGFLGLQSKRRTEAQTVLVTDGTNTVALCHVQDTPLRFSYAGTDWEGLTGVLGRNTTTIPMQSLSFYQLDPRVVLIPVTQAEAQRLGGTAYRTSSDPFKFQDAVLVGAQEGYYGECTFQIDLTTPLYLKMDCNSLKGLFGKFNPSRGDLVFSRTGELLGVMANRTYCLMIKNFDITATFELAQAGRSEQTGETLARLYSLIAKLPYKLQ
jgi:hypothetical protein